jgi:hypothetical protein
LYFAETIALVERYYWKHRRAATPGFDLHRTLEIRLRLRQLSFLYEHIIFEQDKAMAVFERARGPCPDDEIRMFVITPLSEPVDPDDGAYKAPSQFGGPDRLQLYAEAFYYIAHRILALIRQSPSGLPGLQSFNAEGIRRVRNNLLEHAHQQGGAVVPSFSVSSAAGVRLRPVVLEDEEDRYIDAGLPANAQEFRENLNRSLTAAVEG